jgi:hypothetical protein
MSNVKIKANASGTADFTIEAPATDSALTLTLPSVAGELLTTNGDGSQLTGVGVDGLDSDYTSGTAVKIDSSGLVGIGTSNPSEKLNVVGNVRAEASSVPKLQLKRTGATAGNGYIECLGSDDSVDYKIAFAQSANVMSFDVAGSTVMSINNNNELKFNSGYGSAATAYGVRVWCNYNGETNSINGSGNASSITDNGAGDQTVNFSTSLPDTVYATVIGGTRNTGSYEAAFMTHSHTQSTSSVRIMTAKSDQSKTDHTQISIACIR